MYLFFFIVDCSRDKLLKKSDNGLPYELLRVFFDMCKGIYMYNGYTCLINVNAFTITVYISAVDI